MPCLRTSSAAVAASGWHVRCSANGRVDAAAARISNAAAHMCVAQVANAPPPPRCRGAHLLLDDDELARRGRQRGGAAGRGGDAHFLQRAQVGACARTHRKARKRRTAVAQGSRVALRRCCCATTASTQADTQAHTRTVTRGGEGGLQQAVDAELHHRDRRKRAGVQHVAAIQRAGRHRQRPPLLQRILPRHRRVQQRDLDDAGRSADGGVRRHRERHCAAAPGRARLSSSCLRPQRRRRAARRACAPR